jgi:hypothetical protein
MARGPESAVARGPEGQRARGLEERAKRTEGQSSLKYIGCFCLGRVPFFWWYVQLFFCTGWADSKCWVGGRKTMGGRTLAADSPLVGRS